MKSSWEMLTEAMGYLQSYYDKCKCRNMNFYQSCNTCRFASPILSDWKKTKKELERVKKNG